METPSLRKERRKTTRAKSMKEAFLVDPNGIHQILDISKNGLSFKCMADDFFPLHWTVDIIIAGSQIYLEKITVEFVQEKNDYLPSFLSKPTKKVGVKFLAPNEQTISSLVELLYPSRQEQMDQ